MVNRILQILKEENLTASQFADAIDVQRSSMSHILSGRNNPSLDFVHKILKAFPSLNTDWLMFGKGSMYSVNNESTESAVAPPSVIEVEKNETPSKSTPGAVTLDLFGDLLSQPLQNEVADQHSEVISKTHENEVKLEDAIENVLNQTTLNNTVVKEVDAVTTETKISTAIAATPKVVHSVSDTKPPIEDGRKIDRIVIFYTDKTFSTYIPE